MPTRRPQSWYLCSRHMMRERYMFQDLKSKKGGRVILGGNQYGRIVGIGCIVMKPSVSINKIL